MTQGQTLWARGNTALAGRAFARALRLSPQHRAAVVALLWLRTADALRGGIADARQARDLTRLLSEHHALARHDEELWRVYAAAHLLLDRQPGPRAGAVRWFRRGLARKPSDGLWLADFAAQLAAGGQARASVRVASLALTKLWPQVEHVLAGLRGTATTAGAGAETPAAGPLAKRGREILRTYVRLIRHVHGVRAGAVRVAALLTRVPDPAVRRDLHEVWLEQGAPLFTSAFLATRALRLQSPTFLNWVAGAGNTPASASEDADDEDEGDDSDDEGDDDENDDASTQGPPKAGAANTKAKATGASPKKAAAGGSGAVAQAAGAAADDEDEDDEDEDDEDEDDESDDDEDSDDDDEAETPSYSAGAGPVTAQAAPQVEDESEEPDTTGRYALAAGVDWLDLNGLYITSATARADFGLGSLGLSRWGIGLRAGYSTLLGGHDWLDAADVGLENGEGDLALVGRFRFPRDKGRIELGAGANLRTFGSLAYGYLHAEYSPSFSLGSSMLLELNAGVNQVVSDTSELRLIGVRDRVQGGIDFDLTSREFINLFADWHRYLTRERELMSDGYSLYVEAGHRLLLANPGWNVRLSAYVEENFLNGTLPASLEDIVDEEEEVETGDIVASRFAMVGVGTTLRRGLPGAAPADDRRLRLFFDLWAGYLWPLDQLGFDVQLGIGASLPKMGELSISGYLSNSRFGGGREGLSWGAGIKYVY